MPMEFESHPEPAEVEESPKHPVAAKPTRKSQHNGGVPVFCTRLRNQIWCSSFPPNRLSTCDDLLSSYTVPPHHHHHHSKETSKGKDNGADEVTPEEQAALRAGIAKERKGKRGRPAAKSKSKPQNPLDDPKNLKTQRDPRVTVPNKNVRERVRLIRVPKNPQRIRVAKIFWVRKPEKDLKIWMKLVTMMKRSQRCLAAVDAGTPKKVASPAAIPCSGLAAQELRSRSDSFLFSWHDWLSVWAYGLVMACAFELQGQFLQVDMIGDALSHIISFQLIL